MCGILCLMMPGNQGGGRPPNPPTYNPERAHAYSFVQWTQDLLVWSIMSQDLTPSQQCAQIIFNLHGTARDLTRGMTYQEITAGGVVNGRALDPVSYLLTQLAVRFAPLGEETRLAAMHELMSFQRLPTKGLMHSSPASSACGSGHDRPEMD